MQGRIYMKHLEKKVTHLTKKSFEFRISDINFTVSLKLDELRKKIMRAKQAASSVNQFPPMQNQNIWYNFRVSLSGKSGSCSRSFTPPLQPITACPASCSLMLSIIKITIRYSSTFLPLAATKKHGNDQHGNFLDIEMIDRQIRFLWNASGGTTVFTHPLKLQLRPYDLSDDSRSYTIEAERTGHGKCGVTKS